MRALGIVALASISSACSTSPDLEGTLVYRTRDQIRVLDLATSRDELIDTGNFGSLSIAPDARHVAYAATDRILRIADRTRSIRRLPGGGCATTADWVSSSVLTYCVDNGTRVLPSLDGELPRLVTGYGASVSNDGTTIAFVNGRGDVVIETVDGRDQRVLLPAEGPRVQFSIAGFTPDQRAILVWDFDSSPGVRIVSVADGSSVVIDEVRFMGTPFGTPRFLGASVYSADQTELLLQSWEGIVAVTLATGAKRVVATFGDRVSAGAAGFLDEGRVIWVRVEDHSVSDIGSFALSLHVAGPTPDDDVALVTSDRRNVRWSSIAVSPAGFVALPSEVSFVRLDGTVLERNDSSTGQSPLDEILALTSDGNGVIAASSEHEVRYLEPDGTSELLVEADTGSDLLPPFAAYTRETAR